LRLLKKAAEVQQRKIALSSRNTRLWQDLEHYWVMRKDVNGLYRLNDWT